MLPYTIIRKNIVVVEHYGSPLLPAYLHQNRTPPVPGSIGIDIYPLGNYLAVSNLSSISYKSFALGAFGPTRDMGRPIVICAFGA